MDFKSELLKVIERIESEFDISLENIEKAALIEQLKFVFSNCDWSYPTSLGIRDPLNVTVEEAKKFRKDRWNLVTPSTEAFYLFLNQYGINLLEYGKYGRTPEFKRYFRNLREESLLI